MNAKRYVLDSFALLAYLQDEPGARIVQEVLADENAEISLCTMNLGEAYYITHREKGEVEAEKVPLQGIVVTGDPEFKQFSHLSIKWLP